MKRGNEPGKLEELTFPGVGSPLRLRSRLETLFANNRAWADRILRREPQFFEELSQQQAPEYLWIGCSDSRVPANEIVGLRPGELFVHRNVANVVVHTDLNCLSVMQFAVDVLKVRHIIVCGHYGCSGVQATLLGNRLGLVDNWLRHVQDVREKYTALLDDLEDPRRRADRLCELNVIEQVTNVCGTSIARDAWLRGQELTIHGWIYGLQNGLLQNLGMTIRNRVELADTARQAVLSLAGRPPGSVLKSATNGAAAAAAVRATT